MMDKKTIQVVVLCMVVLFGFQFAVNKIWPPIPKKPKPVTTNVVTTTTETNVAAKVEAEVPAEPPVEKPSTGPRPPEQLVVLSNEFVHVEFTSYGGGIRTVRLLRHHTNSDHDVVLNGIGSLPSLSLVGSSHDVFDIQQTAADTVVLRNATGITKTFALSNDYVIVGRVELPAAMAATQSNLSLVVGTATPTELHEPPNYLVVDWQGASKFRNRTLPRVADRVKEGRPREEIHASWVAVKSQYFAMVLTPATNVCGVSYAPVDLTTNTPPQRGVLATVDVPVTRTTAGGATCTFTLYAGPKDYDRLAALGGDHDELMDFGTPMDLYSGVFGMVLQRSLNFFHRLVPNYGVAIILVTIALKVIFWPIQAKSIKSMKEMQKFQPLMQKLREKYKDDQPRMNQEMMKLYKEHKINPLSGCLPMAVQLPVLIGFYRVLISDIALRGASFLWIKDLAQPDTILHVGGFPLNVLPLVMTGATFWQMKITPQSGDNQQQKIMMFMPLMMLFFFYKLAAGLTLYYTLQTVLSVLQQWWSLRQHGPASQPAAKTS